MARQYGAIKLSGTFGEINFYKNKYGFFARRKSSITRERVKNDDAFIRGRENALEFKQAIQAGKLLRDSIRHLLRGASDGLLSSRMNGLFSRVKKLDTVSERGKRKPGIALLHPEAKTLLQGFDFNAGCHLFDLLRRPVGFSDGIIQIDGLIAGKHLVVPPGADQVELKGCVVDFDPLEGRIIRQNTNTVYLPLNLSPTDVVLTADVSPTIMGTRLYVLRIGFLQEINGVNYSFKDGKYTAMAIVGAV